MGIKLVLEDMRDIYQTMPENAFKIERCFNSTAYRIGHFISAEEAEALIKRGWIVEIVKARRK